jgi:hypothetical protein
MKLPPSIDVPSKSGGWVVKEVARVVLCTTATHAALVPDLWTITTKLLELAPKDAPLAHANASGDWTDPVSAKQLERHVRGQAKYPNGTVSIASVRDGYEFELAYHGQAPVWSKRGWASSFTVTFPRERLYADPAAIEAWFADALELAPWTSGTVGLALEGNEWRRYPLSARFMALDVSSPSSCAHDLGDRLFGIAWLTFLSRKLVRALGGVRAVSAAAPASIEVAGGALLRASATPRRGATAAERAPYVKIAKAVEPVLHRPKKVLYLSSPELQLAWHERFLRSAAAYRRAFLADPEVVEGAEHHGTPF